MCPRCKSLLWDKKPGGPRRQVIRTTGSHILYQRLWNAAQHYRHEADRQEPGFYYFYLGASVFAFFGFEGYLNEMGRLIAPDLWADERRAFGSRKSKYRGTLGKLRYLAEISGLRLNTGRRPYKTVRELESARYLVAHLKTEDFDGVSTRRGYRHADPPAPALDKYAAKAFVHRAMADVEALANALLKEAASRFPHELRGRGDRAFVGGITGAWSHSLTD